MISFNPRIRALSIILVVGVLSSFCASKNFLTVNYQLPTESVELKNARVALRVEDKREDPRIVTPNAKKALKNFTGHFTLIVAQENKNDRLVGAFSLSSMVREIFKHRLENAGVRIVAEEDSGVPIVEIILQEFKLDLPNRNWVIKMNYQANLIKQNRVVAGETITGSAERLRAISGKNAEIVIGELVSDVVNRLNLNEFLKLNQIQ
jgi:hypothetical protein